MLENKTLIFLDVETTGLSEKTERMTEIGIIRTDGNFNIIDEFQMLINPERVISSKITEITGITESMVENEPKYDEAIPMIKDFIFNGINKEDAILVAHNAPFDFKFVNQGFMDIYGKVAFENYIDTVSVLREIQPFWRNHKLDTAAKKYGIVNENHHRALNDTYVLYYIAKIALPQFLETGLNPINFKRKK